MKKELSGSKLLTILVLSIGTILIGVLKIKAPTTIVLITSGMVTIFLSLLWGIKWEEIEAELLDTARRMFPAILILMFVGMLVGSWIISGTIPTMIYYGLKMLEPKTFLVVACIICSVMSVMTGTSFGTIGTVGVALMGISTGLGIPLGYTAGAVLVGALFGDKLSPMSDTTILAPAMSGVDVISHIKHMLYTTIPGYVVSLALFAVLGTRQTAGMADSATVESILQTISGTFDMNLIVLLPPFVVLALIFRQKPVLPSFAVGVLCGVLLAMTLQGQTLLEVTRALNRGYATASNVEIVDKMILRGGINSMMSSVAVVIAAATFGAPLKSCGAIGYIVDQIKRFTVGVKSLMAFSYLFHMLLMMVIGGYYTTFSIAGPILQPLFDKYGIHKKNLSRMLEDTGTTFCPLIPWSSGGVFFASTLGVGLADYGLFIPMCYMGPILAAVYIMTGFSITKVDPVVATESTEPESA